MLKEKNKPPVVLLAFANDYQGKNLEYLEAERDEIYNALKTAEHDRLCQVEIIFNATLDKIVNAFRDENYEIESPFSILQVMLMHTLYN